MFWGKNLAEEKAYHLLTTKKQKTLTHLCMFPTAICTGHAFNKCRLTGWQPAKRQSHASRVDIESNYDPQGHQSLRSLK